MVKEYEYVEKKMINQNFKAIKINILAFTSPYNYFLDTVTEQIEALISSIHKIERKHG